jgi:hypothetical protein
MVKRLSYTPILGWSSTRYDCFSICKRRYFYAYYGKYDREVPARDIAAMKELTSVPMAIGSVVHEIIEGILNRYRKSTDAVDRDRFMTYVGARTAEGVASRVFEEVFYGQVPTVDAADLLPKVEACLDNFLSSDRYTWLCTEAIRFRDAWIVDPPGYGETRLGDLKVYCKVDFLCPVDGTHYVIDWKTGRADVDKHRKQMTGYSAWAAFHFDCDPSRVVPILAYLHPQYAEVQETFGAADLERFAIQVRAETDEMYGYCRDVERNIPLDKVEFARIDDERICASCNYRGLCFPTEHPPARSSVPPGPTRTPA